MSADPSPSLVWFRQDLRLDDNPALRAARKRGAPLICVYVLDDDTPGVWAPGGASRWWLHHSLTALADELQALGQCLLLLRGKAEIRLPSLIADTGARAVFWNRVYEPYAVARDKSLKATLQDDGVTVESFNGALLNEPWEITNKSGQPFKVFTPFWRACLTARAIEAPVSAPRDLPPPPETLPGGDDLSAWALQPTKPDWAGGLRESWTPGERGARSRLKAFLKSALNDYAADRDRPDLIGTSRLSPHLHFGEISPRRIWQQLEVYGDSVHGRGRDMDKFRAELGWREFSTHLLFHNPTLPDEALRPEFRAFPWKDDAPALAAWQKGMTGFPIVDAGMRELWHTGWMHNRVRMITASLLVKHLLIPWQQGAAWFWDTLVDADLASNSASWQWVAGCGADAAPYFRIFNPVLQGEKFDPSGAYVRRWVPEISGLPDSHIHKPWSAKPADLAAAGVSLGQTYPHPIIDLAAGRERALSAFQSNKAACA